MPTSTPLYYDDGSRRHVLGMAGSSIGSKKYELSQCDACGATVAWAQSTRTGKWYLCETADYHTDAGHERHRAVPYRYHECSTREPVPAPTPAPTVDGLTADEHRAQADAASQRVAESWERSDTDGFMSQWAGDLSARLHTAQANLLEAGGVAEFPGLFNAAGQRVKARQVRGSDFYGNPEQKWVVLDANDNVLHWVNNPADWHNPSARSKMHKLGLHVEYEQAPAKAKLDGTTSTNVSVITYRTDGGYPEDAVLYEEAT